MAMHSSFVTAAVALWMVTVLADNATCAPPLVAITIGNVTLSNNHVARGLEISIGSPVQPFVFMPQWPMNNSFVYGTDGHCTPDLSTAACTTFRGGAYNGIASTSRTVPDPAAYPVDAAPYASVSHAADTLVLNSTVGTSSNTTTTTLAQFPFGVPLNDLGQQGYHPMNALGLGFNSTVLQALKASGRIASRTWSMFWGLNGADATSQMEGIFVLGGYDKAKVVAGQTTTLPLADAGSVCPSRMVLSITDLVLNFSNGTDASLFPGTASTALQACITPDYPVLMTLPDDPYFKAMETLTNATIEQRSTGLVFFANRYLPGPAAHVYTGDLTITLQSGLAIRIPNDQLIVPDRTIDASTGAIVANSSGLDTIILAIQNVNAGDMTQLGRQFLSAAYVMLNQDANSFSVWQANPTTARQLVAVDESNTEVTACTTSANETSSSASSTSSSTASTSTPRKKTSTGVIVGAAAGGVVAVAAATGLVVFYRLRRRWQQKVAQAVEAAVEAARHKFDPGRGGGHGGSLPGSESTMALTAAEAPADVPLAQPQQVYYQLDARDIKYKSDFHSTTPPPPPPLPQPVIEMEDSSRIELRDWQDVAPRYAPRSDGMRRQTPQYELQG
ncbi:hypothetical protein SCUCBS95973_006466 [Sporothrix curviconia]|uniref:Aspartic-type endopeptidase n=1 Tax=Sporothrix curviconia TaxID=1260050 RepID=A0ABP0C7M1_9PEZI